MSHLPLAKSQPKTLPERLALPGEIRVRATFEQYLDFEDKQSPSLKYAIYIHQHKPFATLCTRTSLGTKWSSEDFVGLDAVFSFEGSPVGLRQLYRKVMLLGSVPPGEVSIPAK